MARTPWNSRAGLLLSAADDFAEARRCIRRAQNWRLLQQYPPDTIARLAKYARILNTKALATRRRAMSMQSKAIYSVAS